MTTATESLDDIIANVTDPTEQMRRALLAIDPATLAPYLVREIEKARRCERYEAALSEWAAKGDHTLPALVGLAETITKIRCGEKP